MNRLNEFVPFDDMTPVEKMAEKHDASLFVISRHSKKRPNSFTLGRMFDRHLMDMAEFHIQLLSTMRELKV